MVEQLSSLCKCFGFVSKEPSTKNSKRRRRKKVPLKNLKRNKSTVHHDSPLSFQSTSYQMHNSHSDLPRNAALTTNWSQESLLSTYKRNHWVHDLESSIVIIGGGQSGIHMASILSRSGYHNITIMERSDGFNADCDGNDNPCYIHPNYDAFFELLGLYDDSNNELLPINTDNTCNIIKYNNDNLLTVQKLNKWTKVHLKSNTVIKAIKKYIKLHKEIFGEYENNSPSNVTTQFPPKPKDISMINMTFMEFLKKHTLNVLIPYFTYSQSLLHGYGHLDEVSAFYGLMWNNVSSMQLLLDPLYQKREHLWTLKKGFKSLFRNMIERERLNIKYNVDITSINRYLNSENHKICLMYTEIVDNEEYEKLMECDVLFCASDMSRIVPLISDITKEEEVAFGNIHAYTLCTTLFEYDVISLQQTNNDNEESVESSDDETCADIDDDDDDEKSDLLEDSLDRKSIVMEAVNKKRTFYPDNLMKKNGHLFRLKNITKEKDNEKNETNFTQTFIGYQMLNMDPETVDIPSLEIKLLDDLKEIGFEQENIKILKQFTRRYCPLWNQNDINAGMPWLVKDTLQGKYKNMYYIGPSVCFQSIEAILEYNIQLQHRLNI